MCPGPGCASRCRIEKLCRIFLLPELTAQLRFHVMRLMFGGQMDAHDFHKVGLTGELLGALLGQAGFGQLQQVESFGEFDDTSELKFGPNRVSLNVVAVRV